MFFFRESSTTSSRDDTHPSSSHSDKGGYLRHSAPSNKNSATKSRLGRRTSVSSNTKSSKFPFVRLNKKILARKKEHCLFINGRCETSNYSLCGSGRRICEGKCTCHCPCSTGGRLLPSSSTISAATSMTEDRWQDLPRYQRSAVNEMDQLLIKLRLGVLNKVRNVASPRSRCADGENMSRGRSIEL